jgi:hypothetical protein
MQGLSELGIDGSYIWAGKFIKNDLALFAGTGFSFKSSDPGGGAKESKDNLFDVNAGLEYFILKKGAVGFHLAPQIEFSSSKRDVGEDGAPYTLKETKLALAVGFGTEWWIADRISFLGGAIVGYKQLNGTRTEGGVESDYSSNTFGFLQDQATLAITFYF